MYDLNKSGSAELPYVEDQRFKDYVNYRFENQEISTRALTKGNGENFILRNERVKIHQIKDRSLKFSQLSQHIRMHARSHLTTSDKEDKVRAVYGAPCTMIYSEIMTLWPIIARLRSQENCFIAWGYETFRGGLERLRLDMSKYDIILTLDYSTFDKLLPFWLFDDIHNIWHSLYEIGPYYEDDPNYPNPGTDPSRINNIWQFMNRYLKRAIYRAPDGSLYTRNHSGLPSGLLQTQLLGSCCNFIMCVSALFSLGFDESQFEIKVLGDDSAIGLKTNLDPNYIIDEISKFCAKYFNAIINTDKSSFSRGTSSLSFLSYKLQDGAVIRNHSDLLGKLVYPENKHFSVSSTKSRAVGILMANLGYDPIVHAVCEDIINYLTDVELTTTQLGWYDSQILKYYIENFKKTPTRDELFNIALKPLGNIPDTNFTKFIRRSKL